MAEVKPMMVNVETIKPHSTAGQAYEVGDTYEVEESAVDNLANQGMAVRVDRVAHAKKQANPATKAPKASAKKSARRKTR